MNHAPDGTVQLEPREVLEALLDQLTREAEAAAEDGGLPEAVRVLELALRQITGDRAIAQALGRQHARQIAAVDAATAQEAPSPPPNV